MTELTMHRALTPTWTKTLGIASFAALTVLCSRVTVPLPFTPVPLTLQVLIVLLSGLVLGRVGGFLSQALVLLAVLFGAPFTASGIAGPAILASPTAGYLFAFPLAAALAGWLGHDGAVSRGRRAMAGALGLLLIYALGTAWLAGFVGGITNAVRLGVIPFILTDALKVTIAVAALSVSRR